VAEQVLTDRLGGAELGSGSPSAEYLLLILFFTVFVFWRFAQQYYCYYYYNFYCVLSLIL